MGGFLEIQRNNVSDSNGNQILWGRMELDGVPFRGREAPLLKSEEWDRRTTEVRDFGYGTFNTEDLEQQHFGRSYLQIMEAAFAGWLKLTEKQTIWMDSEDSGRKVMHVYLEWVVPFRELLPEGRMNRDDY